MASARNVEKLCPREKFENVRVVVNGKVFGVGAADEQGRFVEGHDGLELVERKVDDVGHKRSVDGVEVDPPADFAVGRVDGEVHQQPCSNSGILQREK